MTIDELKVIPFHFVCSAAWETEHTMTYESEDGRLGYCDHTPKRKNDEDGNIVTSEAAIGMTIVQKALSGDLQAVAFVLNLQMQQQRDHKTA